MQSKCAIIKIDFTAPLSGRLTRYKNSMIFGDIYICLRRFHGNVIEGASDVETTAPGWSSVMEEVPRKYIDFLFLYISPCYLSHLFVSSLILPEKTSSLCF